MSLGMTDIKTRSDAPVEEVAVNIKVPKGITVGRIDCTPIRVYDDPIKQLAYLTIRGQSEIKVLGYVTIATLEQIREIEKELEDAKGKSS